MKRHHIVALFLLIFGGLFAYLRFNHGDTEAAIRTGILFGLVAVIMFFLGRLKPQARSLGVNLTVVVVLGIFAYRDFMAGDIVSVIILGILILGIGLTLFQNLPFIKEKNRTVVETCYTRWDVRFIRCAHYRAAFTFLNTIKLTQTKVLWR